MPAVASWEAFGQAVAAFPVEDLNLAAEPGAWAEADRSVRESGFLDRVLPDGPGSGEPSWSRRARRRPAASWLEPVRASARWWSRVAFAPARGTGPPLVLRNENLLRLPHAAEAVVPQRSCPSSALDRTGDVAERSAHRYASNLLNAILVFELDGPASGVLGCPRAARETCHENGAHSLK